MQLPGPSALQLEPLTSPGAGLLSAPHSYLVLPFLPPAHRCAQLLSRSSGHPSTDLRTSAATTFAFAFAAAACRSPVPATHSGTGRGSSALAGSDLSARHSGVGSALCHPGASQKRWGGGERREAIRGTWKRPPRCAPGSAPEAARELYFAKRVGTALLPWRQFGRPSVPLLRGGPPVSSSADCPRAAAKLSAPVTTDSLRVWSPTAQESTGYRAPYESGLCIQLPHANFLSSPQHCESRSLGEPGITTPPPTPGLGRNLGEGIANLLLPREKKGKLTRISELLVLGHSQNDHGVSNQVYDDSDDHCAEHEDD